MSRSRTRKLPIVLLAGIALAASTFAPLTAIAGENVCEDCNIQGLIEEYEYLYRRATELYFEASGKNAEAAEAYEEALAACGDLAGLPSLPGSLDQACDMVVDEVLGKVATVRTAVTGLANAVKGMIGEGEAAEKLASANHLAKMAARSKRCREACCKKIEAAKAAKVVEDNPDVDFTRPLDEGTLDRCLEKLSPGDRSKLVKDVKAGKFDGYMHPSTIGKIKNKR